MRFLVLFGTVFIISSIAPRTSSGLSLSASPLSGQKNDKLEFSERPLAFTQIINADFADSSFTLGVWYQISVKNTNWVGSRLNGTRISRSDFSLIQFVKSDLSGMKCLYCNFKDVLIEDSRLDGTHFFGGSIENLRFIRSNLSRADFVSTSCKNCSVDSATAKTVNPEQLKKWQFLIKDTP